MNNNMNNKKNNKKLISVTAKAPATMANLAVGYDLIGMSVGHLFDEVTLIKTDNKNIEIVSIEGDGGKISKDSSKNTATMPLLALQKKLNLNFGFQVSIKKGIPLSSGLGGSAASAVAATLAANEFLTTKLSPQEIIHYALEGEVIASGSYHADNIAPCLLGGLVLCGQNNQYHQFKLPSEIHYLILHPDQELETKKARQVLPSHYAIKDVIEHSQVLASFMLGLCQQNSEILINSLRDILILPYRKSLIHAFSDLEQIATAIEGVNLHISGAGPTMFSMSTSQKSLTNFLSAIKKNNFDKKYGLNIFHGQGSSPGASIVTKNYQ